jgi:hypothetical protein
MKKSTLAPILWSFVVAVPASVAVTWFFTNKSIFGGTSSPMPGGGTGASLVPAVFRRARLAQP